ncbi:MAG: hypothetical protein AAFO15_02585 [Pseudomonadota bacterium]
MLTLNHPDILNNEDLTTSEYLNYLDKMVKQLTKCNKVKAIIVNLHNNNCYGTEYDSIAYHLSKTDKPIIIYGNCFNMDQYLFALKSRGQIYINKYGYTQLFQAARVIFTSKDLFQKLKIEENIFRVGSHKALGLFDFEDEEKILDKLKIYDQTMVEIIKRHRPNADLSNMNDKLLIYADEAMKRQLFDKEISNIYLEAEELTKSTQANKIVLYNQIKPKKRQNKPITNIVMTLLSSALPEYENSKKTFQPKENSLQDIIENIS